MDPREESNQIHHHEMELSAFSSCDSTHYTHSQSRTSGGTGTVHASRASNPTENFAATEEAEDDEEYSSEEQGDYHQDMEDEEYWGKERENTQTVEEEDESADSLKVEELENKIEEMCKRQSEMNKKIFESSQLPCPKIGQDRYRRQYYVFPQCGGVFVEGMESAEGYKTQSPSTTEHLESLNTCASIPPAEAMIQDYPNPQPIPEDMLSGWWRVSDKEELQRLVQALNSRGIREQVLQKEMQSHLEYMIQPCTNNSDSINVTLQEQQEVWMQKVKDWNAEEHAMKADIDMLQKVEELEKDVIDANLQVKGWMHPKPESGRKDLVYYEHKLCSTPERVQRDNSQEEFPGVIVRQPNNPLDIAVTRLGELEQNIKRGDEGKHMAKAVMLWRKALSEVCSAAQLSLCLEQLQEYVSWRCFHKSQKSSSRQKTVTKRKRDDSSQAESNSCGPHKKKSKMTQDDDRLAICRVMLAELEVHEDAWPFLKPVSSRLVPGYREIIKTPMDFSTIKRKLGQNMYSDKEMFLADVKLIFDNCQIFNEDLSVVGQAGHSMRSFFEKRWAKLLKDIPAS